MENKKLDISLDKANFLNQLILDNAPLLMDTVIHEVNNVLGGRICQVNHVGIIYNGKKTILEIFQDITERKKDKEEIEMLLNTIEQTSEIIFITDHNGIIKYVNPSFEKNTGYTKLEIC